MDYKAILYPAMSATMFLLSNLGAKLSLNPGSGWLMVPVCAGGVLAYWFFRLACQTHGLAVTSSIVDILVTIISIIVGIFFLNEQLLVRQYVGLAVLFVGLYLIR